MPKIIPDTLRSQQALRMQLASLELVLRGCIAADCKEEGMGYAYSTTEQCYLLVSLLDVRQIK